MAITFTKTINLPSKVKAMTAKHIENFGEAMKDRYTVILARLAKGEGPEGKLTPKYSDAYAKRKANRGKPKQTGKGQKKNQKETPVNAGSQVVNMRWSGNMLNSMIVDVIKTEDGAVGLIKFGSSQIDKVKGNQETRNFFGLNSDDIKRIKIRTFKK